MLLGEILTISIYFAIIYTTLLNAKHFGRVSSFRLRSEMVFCKTVLLGNRTLINRMLAKGAYRDRSGRRQRHLRAVPALVAGRNPEEAQASHQANRHGLHLQFDESIRE